jgi:hypothetical protein
MVKVDKLLEVMIGAKMYIYLKKIIDPMIAYPFPIIHYW